MLFLLDFSCLKSTTENQLKSKTVMVWSVLQGPLLFGYTSNIIKYPATFIDHSIAVLPHPKC